MKVMMLLFPIEHFNRTDIELIEHSAYKSVHDMFIYLKEKFDTLEKDIICYTLSEFTQEFNDESIIADDYWITYVFVGRSM